MDLASQIIDSCATREEALSKLWSERKKYDGQDSELFEKLEDAEKTIKQVQVVNLSVPIGLDIDEIIQIAQKAQVVFGQKVFLEIRVDPSLMGGCVFVWKGLVYDYSLKKTIQDKRKEFKEILNGSWIR